MFGDNKKERGKVFKDFRRYFVGYYSRIFRSSHIVTHSSCYVIWPMTSYLAGAL